MSQKKLEATVRTIYVLLEGVKRNVESNSEKWSNEPTRDQKSRLKGDQKETKRRLKTIYGTLFLCSDTINLQQK